MCKRLCNVFFLITAGSGFLRLLNILYMFDDMLKSERKTIDKIRQQENSARRRVSDRCLRAQLTVSR